MVSVRKEKKKKEKFLAEVIVHYFFKKSIIFLSAIGVFNASQPINNAAVVQNIKQQ